MKYADVGVPTPAVLGRFVGMGPGDWLIMTIGPVKVVVMPVLGSFSFVHFDRLIDRFISGLTTALGDADRIAINVQETTLNRKPQDTFGRR